MSFISGQPPTFQLFPAEVPTLGLLLALANLVAAGPAAPSSKHPAFDPGDWRVLGLKQKTGVVWEIPSGKRLHNYGNIHHFLWENQLFLWSFFNSKRLDYLGNTLWLFYIAMEDHHFYICSSSINGSFSAM